MYRLLQAGTAAVAILMSPSLVQNSSAAISLSGLADIPLALERDNPIEKVALCFYLDGWNGPGLYEAGRLLPCGLRSTSFLIFTTR